MSGEDKSGLEDRKISVCKLSQCNSLWLLLEKFFFFNLKRTNKRFICVSIQFAHLKNKRRK